MADKNRTDSKAGSGQNETLRAGASKEEERDARSDAKETHEDEVIEEAAAEEPIIELLKEVPEGGVVVEEPLELSATAVGGFDATFGRTYDDDNVGKGGTYIIDPKTGERQRQYEAVKSDKGKTLGYRPVP